MSERAEFGLYFPMKPVGQDLVQRAFEEVGESIEEAEKAGEDFAEGMEELQNASRETGDSLDELTKYAGMTRGEFEAGLDAFNSVTSGLDTIGGAAARLRGGLEDVTEAFGIENAFINETLIPGLRGLEGSMDLITGSVQMMSGIFDTAMSIKTAAMWAFNIACHANPFILIAMAIIGVLAILYMAWETNFGGIRDILTGFWGWIQEKFGWLIEILEKVIPVALWALGEAWNFVWSGIQSIIEGVWRVIGPIIEAIEGALRWVSDAVGVLEDAWNTALGGSLRVSPETFRDIERLREGLGGITPTPGTIGGGVSASSEVNVNVYGPVSPTMVPILARETKRAAYEGMNEAIRDGLRRRGVKIWRGY